MSDVRAFVGHSFTPDDANVVGEFLKLFERLAKMNPLFTWEHAEAAEAKLLTEKVLSLVQDKNLFIGICTRKEKAGQASQFKRVPFFSRWSFVEASRSQWKTSDWIIQEIGMAAGLKFKLLLLIEEGVRNPGGLQGDVEYIPFDRATPEKAFGKIIEMITALTQNMPGAIQPMPGSVSGDKSSEPEAAIADDSWKEPKADWSQESYRHALFRMIFSDDVDGVNKIDSMYQASPLCASPEAKAAWTSCVEFYKILSGKAGDLEKLKVLAKEYPEDAKIHSHLAYSLRKFEQHLEAANQFEIAASKSEDIDDQLSLMGHSAREYDELDQIDLAFSTRNRMRLVFAESNEANEADYLRALLPSAEEKKTDFELAALERIVELRPNDVQDRFRLAFAHSRNDNEDMSLLHYMRVPVQERDAVTWNNLGAAYQHFQASARAVAAYKKGESKGETLAMSNLGYLLASAGFTEDAEALCKKAMTYNSYNKNCVQLLSHLKDVPEDETKKIDEITKAAAKKHSYYERFGQAVGRVALDLSGEWIGPECILTLSVAARDMVSLTGHVEREANSLALLGMGAASSNKILEQVKFVGHMQGQGLALTVSRTSDGAARTLLGGIETKVLMFVGSNGNGLEVVENPNSPTPRFYSLSRRVALEARSQSRVVSSPEL